MTIRSARLYFGPAFTVQAELRIAPAEGRAGPDPQLKGGQVLLVVEASGRRPCRRPRAQLSLQRLERRCGTAQEHGGCACRADHRSNSRVRVVNSEAETEGSMV